VETKKPVQRKPRAKRIAVEVPAEIVAPEPTSGAAEWKLPEGFLGSEDATPEVLQEFVADLEKLTYEPVVIWLPEEATASGVSFGCLPDRFFPRGKPVPVTPEEMAIIEVKGLPLTLCEADGTPL